MASILKYIVNDIIKLVFYLHSHFLTENSRQMGTIAGLSLCLLLPQGQNKTQKMNGELRVVKIQVRNV